MSYRVIGVPILLSLILFCNELTAQNDSKKQQWLNNNYMTEYLHKVLTKKHFNYVPPNGVVPDSETANNLAILVLSKAYGKDTIEKEKPFTVLFKDGYWIVYGYLPDDYLGGVAEIVIRKNNGEIINISHGK